MSNREPTGTPDGTEYYSHYWKELIARSGRKVRITGEKQEEVFVESHSDMLKGVFDTAPGTLIANFGCGRGTHSVPMEHRGFRVVNADFSPEALELTRDFYKQSGLKPPMLVRCDILHLPFRDETFDVTMNFGVMEHFHDIEPPYKEMSRTLKQGGVFHSEIVTRRFSLLSIDVFVSAFAYAVYNLCLLRWHKLRALSRTAHMGEDFFENSYPLRHYEDVIERCGVRRLRSFGVRPYPSIAIPPWMDRAYATVLGMLMPVFRRITLSGSAMSKRICPIWLVYGTKGGRTAN